MATASLRNVPLLDRIESSGISTFRFCTICIAAGVVAASLLAVFSYWGVPEGKPLPRALLPATTFLLTVVGFCYLALSFYFARTTDADVLKLAQSEPAVSSSLDAAGFSKGVVLSLMLVNFAAYFGAMLMIEVSIISGDDLPERLTGFLSDLPTVLLYLVALPTISLGATPMTVIILQQPLLLTRVARSLSIDVKRLHQYQAISNPFTRIVIGYTILGLLFPLMLLPVGDLPWPIIAAMFFILAVIVTIAFAYFVPIVVLRNRIRKAVQQELDDVTQLILTTSGDQQALMIRQMFLESRPSWPIATSIQRVVAFGLLPPIAWTLSAMVENMLF